MTTKQSEEILQMEDRRKAISRAVELADDKILEGLFFVVLNYVRRDDKHREWVDLASKV